MESDKNGKVLLYALLITLTFHMSHALITGRDLVFNKLGEYGTKQYFIPKYAAVDWSSARRSCEEFEMEFARLEHPDEGAFIINLVLTSTLIPSSNTVFMVDGIATTPGQKTGWFWVRNRHAINYAMTWHSGQPDDAGRNERCLSILKRSGRAGYNDVSCSGSRYNFICQYDPEDFINPTNRIVGVVKPVAL